MPDTSGQVATSHDTVYSLTIDEAAALYARAGHPRTPRSVQRYCASGHLDAIKEATTLGDKYFIEPQSVARHIAQIEELIALDNRAPSRDRSRHVASQVNLETTRGEARHEQSTEIESSSSVAAPDNAFNSVAQAHDGPRQGMTVTEVSSRPVATGNSDTSRYVVGLEREVERALEDRAFLHEQIKVKDTQIAALLERDRETNILVRGLQQMLSPLLGPVRRDPLDEGSQPHF